MSTPAPAADVSPWLIARRVATVLARMEQFEGTGAVEIRDGDTAVATMLLCEGRICYVAGVPGIANIGELVEEQDPSSAAGLRVAIETAKSTGRLLGETMLELGEVSLIHIHEALQKQILLALEKLLRGTEPDALSTVWRPLRGHFDPRLTYAPIEICRGLLHRTPPERDVAVELYEDQRDNRFSALVRHDSAWAAPALLVDSRGVLTESCAARDAIARCVYAASEQPSLRAAGIAPTVVLATAEDAGCIVVRGPLYVTMIGGIFGEFSLGWWLRRLARESASHTL